MTDSPDSKMKRFAARHEGRITPRGKLAVKSAAFRAAISTSETRLLPYRCAVTGKPYVVVFSREDPEARFTVLRIEKQYDGDAGEDSTVSARVGREPGSRQQFDYREFDRRGRSCPWCGNDTMVVNCTNCGESVCGGRVRAHEDGTESFMCHDGCGNSGTLVRSGAMYGRPGKAARRFRGEYDVLPGPAGKRGTTVKRLPPPEKKKGRPRKGS